MFRSSVLTWLKWSANSPVDGREGVLDIGGQWVSGFHCVITGLDFDGAVAALGSHEFFD